VSWGRDLRLWREGCAEQGRAQAAGDEGRARAPPLRRPTDGQGARGPRAMPIRGLPIPRMPPAPSRGGGSICTGSRREVGTRGRSALLGAQWQRAVSWAPDFSEALSGKASSTFTRPACDEDA